MADAEEAGPSRRPEEPVLEQTVPLPSDEASSGVVLVGRDPFSGDAHAFHGWMRTAIHCSSSTMWRSRRCGPSSESWLGASWQSSWPSPSLFTASAMSRTLQRQKGLLDHSNEQLAWKSAETTDLSTLCLELRDEVTVTRQEVAPLAEEVYLLKENLQKVSSGREEFWRQATKAYS